MIKIHNEYNLHWTNLGLTNPHIAEPLDRTIYVIAFSKSVMCINIHSCTVNHFGSLILLLKQQLVSS